MGIFFDFFNEIIYFFSTQIIRKKLNLKSKLKNSQFICRKNDKFCVKITRMGYGF